jgi:hypothetical protein
MLSVKSVVSVVCQTLPVCPDQRTSPDQSGWSSVARNGSDRIETPPDEPFHIDQAVRIFCRKFPTSTLRCLLSANNDTARP